MTERVRAAFRLLEALTLRPRELDPEFIAALESDGLGRDEVEEVASVAFHFNFINRFVEALSLHAHQLHDRLVQELVAAGYSQQVLFEVTLIVAFGAALAGQEHLFGALLQVESRAS